MSTAPPVSTFTPHRVGLSRLCRRDAYQRSAGVDPSGRPEAEPYLGAYHGCRQDLIELYKHDIEQRARELSQNNPGNTPDANWHQAQKEIIRESFSTSITMHK